MTPCHDSDMTPLFDTHTHTLREDALVNLDPAAGSGGDVCARAPYFYSAGIHPWHADRADEGAMERLRSLASHPRVLAIGETGLDTLHSPAPDLDAQMRLLKQHIALSEQTAKPLILHVVRRYAEIMALRRACRPSQPWIIHGFRGKPQLARQLLAAGFMLSYGEKANPASVAVTPVDRLLIESDESSLSARDIATRLGVDECATCIADKARQLGALDGAPLEDA